MKETDQTLEENKKKRTKKHGKLKKAIAISSLTLGILAGAVFSPTPTDKSLPTKAEIVENLETFGADTSYLCNYSGIQNTPFTRIKMDTSKPLTFCLSENYSDEEVAFIQYIIDDLNLIFEHINPNYKFELQKGVPTGAVFDNNTIPIVRRENCGKIIYDGFSEAAGWAMRVPTLNLDGTMSFRLANISVKNTGDPITFKYSEEMVTTAHEILHMVGLGDAYIVEGQTAPTIMQSDCGLNHGFFMENDLYLLASLYGKFNSNEDYQNFVNFAQEYCATRDLEVHMHMADSPYWSESRPPHVSQADYAEMTMNETSNFLNWEWFRYNNGKVTQEEIDAATEREQQYIKQQSENCTKWQLNQEELTK